MKIYATILLKNRRTKTIKVNPEKPFFIYNGTVYILDHESVGLRSKNGILSPKPMIMYWERIPTAIRIENKDLGESAKLLDNFVLENEYKSSAKVRAPFNWAPIKNLFNNPTKIATFLISIGVGAYVFKMFLFDIVMEFI